VISKIVFYIVGDIGVLSCHILVGIIIIIIVDEYNQIMRHLQRAEYVDSSSSLILKLTKF